MIVVDTEVLKHYWLLVALDLKTKEYHIIENDKAALEKFYKKYKNEIWVGYNIRNYDQHIIKGILCDFNPYEISQWIIAKDQSGYAFSNLLFKIKLTFFDIQPNPPVGLKTLEGFMGEDIRETTVPFDLPREPTRDEKDQLIFYCKHDVYQTALVLNNRWEEFQSQLELLRMFNMPISEMSKTKAQLTAKILDAHKQNNRGDEFAVSFQDTVHLKKYKYIQEWFEDICKKGQSEVELDLDRAKEIYSNKLSVDVAGVPHEFAWGGLHGAKPSYHGVGEFVNVDVALN